MICCAVANESTEPTAITGTVASAPMNWVVGQWYDFKIAIDLPSGRAIVFVDGNPILAYTCPEDLARVRAFQVQAFQPYRSGDLRLDDFRVSTCP